MSGFDDLSYTTVNVNPTANTNGTATTLASYLGSTGSHYQCDVTRVTLSGQGSGATPPSANIEPTFGATGGADYAVFCDVTNGACFVDLPVVDLSKNPNLHPLRGREIAIYSNGTAANAVTITAPTVNSGNAAPQINSNGGGANAALLPASTKKGVTLIFDGLNWNLAAGS